MNLNCFFDQGRRLISQEQIGSSAQMQAGFAYGYNRTNMRLYESRLHDSNQGRVWSYDSAYRMNQEKRDVQDPLAESQNPGSGGNIGAGVAHALDGVNNITQVTNDSGSFTNAINNMNEYTSFDGQVQTHDNNGNRTQAGSFTYAYDALNRLRVVFNNSIEIARYTYDAANRRIEKIFPNQSGLRFVYKNWDLLEERDRQSNALIRQYVQGAHLNEVLQLQDSTQGNPLTYYYLTDALGSIVGLTDTAGSIVQSIKYDGYGQAQTLFGAIANPLLFTAAYLDQESNLYHFRNRYYDATQGRFISRDPIGMWTDAINSGNGYAYVGNNPVNWLDPLGLIGGGISFSGRINAGYRGKVGKNWGVSIDFNSDKSIDIGVSTPKGTISISSGPDGTYVNGSVSTSLGPVEVGGTLSVGTNSNGELIASFSVSGSIPYGNSDVGAEVTSTANFHELGNTIAEAIENGTNAVSEALSEYIDQTSGQNTLEHTLENAPDNVRMQSGLKPKDKEKDYK